MDDARIGKALRVVRIRGRLRQEDVARRARVSRHVVGDLELGRAGRHTVDALGAVATALGMSVDVLLRWHGAELDRVLASTHAAMHESVAAILAALPDWVCLAEVTFARYAERATMHRRVRLGRWITVSRAGAC